MSRADDETKFMGRVPTIGRIVVYRSLGDADGKYPAEDHPALITGVNRTADGTYDGTVALHVFYRTGGFDMEGVEETPTIQRGKWRWPERVS
jgi:hypothetical protein